MKREGTSLIMEKTTNGKIRWKSQGQHKSPPKPKHKHKHKDHKTNQLMSRKLSGASKNLKRFIVKA